MERSPSSEREVTDDEVNRTIIDCKIKVWYGNTDIIREVAKRSDVRLLWSLSKSTGMPLISGPILTLNPTAKKLLYWLSFYHNIETAHDRPPTRVIQNDTLLEKWLTQKNEEAEQEFEKNWRQGSLKVPKSARDHDEVYVLGDFEDEGEEEV